MDTKKPSWEYGGDTPWWEKQEDASNAKDPVRQKQERAVDLCELSIMKYLEGAGQDHHKAGIRAAINRMRGELWGKRQMR